MDKKDTKRLAIISLYTAISRLKFAVELLELDTDDPGEAEKEAEVSVRDAIASAKKSFYLLERINNPTNFPPGGISTGRADEFITGPTGKPREFEIRTPMFVRGANNRAEEIESSPLLNRLGDAAKLREYEKALAEAVKDERLEEAAELRDKIEQIKGR